MRMTMDYNTKSAIIGGTVFGILPNIPPNDLIITIIMAFTGALVSFIASLLFKYLAKLFKKEK